MSNVIDIEKYAPSSDDRFFLDCNIWMFLYCPIGNYKQKKIKKYDSFLKKILNSNSKIFINSLLLSEFYNTYLRLDFNIWNKNNGNNKNFKKDFRSTPQHKNTISEINYSLENQILEITEKLDDGFANINIEDTFNRIEKVDFNDSYYIDFIVKNNLKIVTDDKDFLSIEEDIDIITVNTVSTS